MARAVASPLVPAVLLMVAMFAGIELQLESDVRFFVVLSLYFPVAVNCCVAPGAILGFVGVISRDTSGACAAGRTDNVADLDKAPNVAVIVVVPVAWAVASPLVPSVLLMVATAVFDELHVTAAVASRVAVLFLQVPVAVNCCLAPMATLVVAGVTACMDESDSLRTQELLAVLLGEGHWETRLWSVHSKQPTVNGNPW